MMRYHNVWWPALVAVVVAAACLAPIPAAQTVTQQFGLVRVDDGTYVGTALGPKRNQYDGWYFPSTGVAIWSANGNPAVALSSKVLAATFASNSGGYCFAPTENVAQAQQNNTVDACVSRVQAGIVGFSGGDVLPGATIKIGDPGTRPTCVLALRGTLWNDEGAAGVKDSVAICAKAADNSYDWRVLY